LDVRPCALAIVVRVDIPEGTILDAIRTERDTIRSERRIVRSDELTRVDIAGVKVDESPSIKGGELNVAKLAP
jgi:hypothetical protein